MNILLKKVLSVNMAVFFATVIVSCKGKDACVSGERQTLRVVNWNVQTFFDAENDGNEYPEFIKSKKWCEDAYKERLRRLCKSIQQFDADVMVMEELENSRVLQDVSNFLAGEWSSRRWYVSGCFTKDAGSSIGCGVISRFPVEDVRVHSLDIRTEREQMPRMRPLMEFCVRKNGKSLLCMVCHWKSKSGGEAESERWRNLQESVLCERVLLARQRSQPVLICGDFNRDITDFCAGTEAGDIIMREMLLPGSRKACVRSPWFDECGRLVEPGSYYFKDGWSRIDNFFCDGAEISMFRPETDGPWCDGTTSVPYRYTVWNGSGFSDHLPVSCTVSF